MPANAAVDICTSGWQSDVIVSGLGGLENLEPDRHGGFYVSGLDKGIIYHVDSQPAVSTVLSGLDHPAGLRVVGNNLYFVTVGSSPGTGTLQRLDLTTGQVAVLLSNLVQPNGMLLLPDGDLLITQLSIPGPPVGVSRYSPATGEFIQGWSTTPRPNGIGLAADREAVYTEDDLTSQIIRIPLDNPAATSVVATVADGPLPVLDDLDVAADGSIYVAGNVARSIYRVDPETGSTCAIATDFTDSSKQPLPPNGPSSVRIAPDGPRSALYITGFDGTLRRLRPPPGLDVSPVSTRASEA